MSTNVRLGLLLAAVLALAAPVVWAALEYFRGIDDVDWTYITPPKRFTDKDRTGAYRVGGDQVPTNERGRSRISRADFAVAIVDEAESAAHVRNRFSVAN